MNPYVEDRTVSKGDGNHRLRTLPFHEHVLRLLGRYLISEKLPGERTKVENAQFDHWRKRYLIFLNGRPVTTMLEEVGRWVSGTRIPKQHREAVTATLKEVYQVMPNDRGALDAIKSALHSLGVERMPSRASKE
ncbi:hypothetical protein HY624_01635 [Candidatus Uhrbacteria bacterium]|nr:hypothetical protein [Candidatus Uhrbacteria bacterium]